MSEAVKLSIELVERRNTLRDLLGDKYKALVDEHRRMLVAINKAQKPSETLLVTAQRLAKEIQSSGTDPSMLFAAFVEEVEAANGR